MRTGILPGAPYPPKYPESAPADRHSRHEPPQSSTAVHGSQMRAHERAQGWLDLCFYLFSFVLTLLLLLLILRYRTSLLLPDAAETRKLPLAGLALAIGLFFSFRARLFLQVVRAGVCRGRRVPRRQLGRARMVYPAFQWLGTRTWRRISHPGVRVQRIAVFGAVHRCDVHSY